MKPFHTKIVYYNSKLDKMFKIEGDECEKLVAKILDGRSGGPDTGRNYTEPYDLGVLAR